MAVTRKEIADALGVTEAALVALPTLLEQSQLVLTVRAYEAKIAAVRASRDAAWIAASKAVDEAQAARETTMAPYDAELAELAAGLAMAQAAAQSELEK